MSQLGALTYKPIRDLGIIPDTLLMEGLVYDIFDKGTDIKTADYSNRRMSPIEDFAVGIPPTVKYVHRRYDFHHSRRTLSV